VFDKDDRSIWLQMDREPHQVAQSAYHEAVHRCQHSGTAGDGSDVEREATAQLRTANNRRPEATVVPLVSARQRALRPAAYRDGHVTSVTWRGQR
jgi:hypothetical protein